MRTQLMNMLQERKDEITQIRRHLHEHPELSFHETETANFIQDFTKEKTWKWQLKWVMVMPLL